MSDGADGDAEDGVNITVCSAMVVPPFPPRPCMYKDKDEKGKSEFHADLSLGSTNTYKMNVCVFNEKKGVHTIPGNINGLF